MKEREQQERPTGGAEDVENLAHTAVHDQDNCYCQPRHAQDSEDDAEPQLTLIVGGSIKTRLIRAACLVLQIRLLGVGSRPKLYQKPRRLSNRDLPDPRRASPSRRSDRR
jgi:hypothetical protein